MIWKDLIRAPASSAKWLAIARRLFVPIAFAFLAYAAYHASDALAPVLVAISIPHVAAACICWAAAQWVGPLATAALAQVLGLPLGYRELSLISILRLPAKYLPGGIWQSVARFVAYRVHHIRNADSITILVVEHVVALGTSMALGAGILALVGDAPFAHSIVAGILVAGIGLVLLPGLWISRMRPDRIHAIAWMSLVAGATLAFWALAAAAFCAYWVAVFGIGAGDLAKIASGYLLAWAAGFVALFAPQGLGVFEWVAAQVLPSVRELAVLVTVLAGFRIVMIVGDLMAWTIGVLIARARGGAER